MPAVAESAEPEAVKAAISELPRLHGGAEVLDRVDTLLAAAGSSRRSRASCVPWLRA